MAHEMRTDGFIMRLDGRVFELFAVDSSWTWRAHVDLMGVAAKEPDRDGSVKVKFGNLIDGNFLNAGTAPKLSAEEWVRFQALYELVKAARTAGPEPW